MVGILKVEGNRNAAHVLLQLSFVDAPRVLHNARLSVDPAAVSGTCVVSRDVVRAILLADDQPQVGHGPVHIVPGKVEDLDHL